MKRFVTTEVDPSQVASKARAKYLSVETINFMSRQWHVGFWHEADQNDGSLKRQLLTRSGHSKML